MASNWDLWKRMLINVDKALCNEEVAVLLAKHYKYLHSRLVKYEEDEDVFNDTYLKLSYNYKPDEDFIELYCYYFNLLKGAYYRDSKVTNWLVLYIEDKPVEIGDQPEEPAATLYEDNFIDKLKEKINASTEKARKNKEKNHKERRLAKGLQVPKMAAAKKS